MPGLLSAEPVDATWLLPPTVVFKTIPAAESHEGAITTRSPVCAPDSTISVATPAAPPTGAYVGCPTMVRVRPCCTLKLPPVLGRRQTL